MQLKDIFIKIYMPQITIVKLLLFHIVSYRLFACKSTAAASYSSFYRCC